VSIDRNGDLKKNFSSIVADRSRFDHHAMRLSMIDRRRGRRSTWQSHSDRRASDSSIADRSL